MTFADMDSIFTSSKMSRPKTKEERRRLCYYAILTFGFLGRIMISVDRGFGSGSIAAYQARFIDGNSEPHLPVTSSFVEREAVQQDPEQKYYHHELAPQVIKLSQQTCLTIGPVLSCPRISPHAWNQIRLHH